ncbi:MAG: glycoside hydrolase family 9 protein [Hyphomonas sp.]
MLVLAVVIMTACGRSVSPQIDLPTRPASADAAPAIVFDQFGYRPGDPKIVRVRQPVTGFDVAWAEAPRMTYYVRSADTKDAVRSFSLDAAAGDVPVDEMSGDKVLALDITRIAAPGEYIVTSGDGVQVSGVFSVRDDVYRPVLRDAFRTFYYQRAGFAKAEPHAGPGWTDAASHLGSEQDTEARLYSAPGDARTARDLRGGWFDAGDYNQYTNMTANQCRTLLISYQENPGAWGDNFGIPESGNGIPDILDEARWGLDWLLRMQNKDGSVLSVLGRGHATPPSAAHGPSRYGPASTSATLSAAGTFAYGALVFGDSPVPAHKAYAARLKTAALAAWKWSEANPAVTFFNNDARNKSEGLGTGQQEVDPRYRRIKRFAAAIYLAALTGDEAFEPVVEEALAASTLTQTALDDEYHYETLDAAQVLVRQPTAPPELGAQLARFLATRLPPGPATGYGVPADAPGWGGNGVIARTGVLYFNAGQLAENAGTRAAYTARALDLVHYLHGANPMGKTYLTNMGARGAETSVMTYYHNWKTEVPIPGFLVGGPNPDYDWDGCCPDSCGSLRSNAACGRQRLSPPYGQPPLKSYLDFDDGWPRNSWEVTENANVNQAAYLRLLANFVE